MSGTPMLFLAVLLGLIALPAAATPREELKQQIRLRPEESWPRGAGHVVLAWPGSKEKAYHEPGGSFSPAVGSFGVSILIEASTTSDTIPLQGIRQTLLWPPGVRTTTQHYRASWFSRKRGRWTLKLEPAAALTLLVRSAGPAGGPIRSMDWNGDRLLINHEWSMSINPRPAGVAVGEEDGELSGRVCKSQSGWCQARFELARRQTYIATIANESNARRLLTRAEVMGGTGGREWTPTVDVPDPRFPLCLNSQVVHLLMGLVEGETRPGDPTNYPLAWLRDGAYTLVALARARQLQAARALAPYFAENDFFGGFGSEADAPGLALWALEEVAARLRDPEFDARLWPHLRRKAELILELLTATGPVRRPWIGPIVPKHRARPDNDLVAEAVRDGLIAGRMDHHRPLLFVNAVSYRGLLDAASFAERRGYGAEAERWRVAAARIQKAWERAFQTPEAENERTYISGLWPTWIAARVADGFLRGLETRWNKLRDERGGFRKPRLWTYFDIAEAHQWLFLGEPERAWKTVEWYWRNQASPGLYTWWEGNGEENTFHLWEQVRGWVDPPHVTPHYWTAAEMLLLQLDMLAYSTGTEVVVGAGVRPEWLKRRISAKRLSLREGRLDWEWDGRRVRVRMEGFTAPVRLGPTFPENTPVQIH